MNRQYHGYARRLPQNCVIEFKAELNRNPSSPAHSLTHFLSLSLFYLFSLYEKRSKTKTIESVKIFCFHCEPQFGTLCPGFYDEL